MPDVVLKTQSVAQNDPREKAISYYHQLLAEDATLSPAVLDRLQQAMRAQRLIYGNRPIGVSLRPHLLECRQFELLARTAELVVSALEKVATAAVQSPALMAQLGLTEMEQKLATIDPGFRGAAITSRMDGFVRGDEISFVEYNAENPSSLSDQEGINRVLSELSAMSFFAERYELREVSPTQKLLETLLATYREWGGTGAPRIAIVDWKNLPTANEFVLLQEYFVERGFPTIICSPDELEYHRGKLRCGDFEIDLVYKRVIIHEFVARYNTAHPLVRACANHDVCVVNPFRCKILHKKASFELLTDQLHQSWFNARERDAITRSVPWTRRITDRRTKYGTRTVELADFVRRNRSHLVLKPNDDYGGHGVYIGPRLDQREWEDAVSFALSADYVVQEAVDLEPEEFPIFNETDWSLQPMFVDTNPFLFSGKVCGAMVRLSNSPVVNVTSGGGETGFLVLEGIRSQQRQAPLSTASRGKKRPANRNCRRASRYSDNDYMDMNSLLLDAAPAERRISREINMSARKARKHDHVFTLGIEEEFQIIDPETRELRSHIQEILADGKMLLKEHVKPEMHQSVVELGTEICRDAREARQQVVDLRSELASLAARDGLKIASAGTHPFSDWKDQLITADERYATIVKDMQQIARINLIFGLHVHVGIPDREEAIDIMNQARYFLPHLYALSTNSPFWLGQNTGLKAYRQMIFERFPQTGIPDAFESLSEYEDYLKLLVSTNCIDNAKKIWWDVRLHPFFDTIEFRICDAQSRVDDTIALAALMQAIVFKLQKLRRDNVTFRSYPRRLIDENRWRAARYGIDGKLIDFGRKCEMDERNLLDEMLGFVSAEMDELGNQAEMVHIQRIMREGTGADRQLEVWENSQDLKAVVDHIVAETYQGLHAPKAMAKVA